MITLAEHSHRRAALLTALRQHTPDPVAVLQGGPKESAHARFRQVNDFQYLCPVETPHAYLVIDGRGGEDVTHLFLPYQPASRLKSEGPLVSATDLEHAKRVTGVDQAHGIDELAGFLERVRTVHTPIRRGEGMLQSWDTLQRAQIGRAHV